MNGYNGVGISIYPTFSLYSRCTFHRSTKSAPAIKNNAPYSTGSCPR